MCFQPTLLDKVLDHSMRSIGMDLQFGRKRPHRWERLSRRKLAADECLCGGVNNLVDNRFSGAKPETEECHQCIVTVVVLTGQRKSSSIKSRGPRRSASVTSSCLLSFTLLAERLHYFHLNRNKTREYSSPKST